MTEELTGADLYEDAEEIGTDEAAEQKRWCLELEKAEEDESTQEWRLKSSRIVQRYKNREQGSNYSYNVLWSNVQTLQPALYSRTPRVVCRRRFPDKDPLGRAACQILESAAHFQIEDYDFDSVMTRSRDDYLLTGMGQAWVRYVPVFGQKKHYLSEEEPEAPEGEEVIEGEHGLYWLEEEALVSEKAVADYLHWKDFLFNPCRYWEEVRWVAKRVYMTLDEMKAHFGKKRNDDAEPLTTKQLKTILEDVDSTHINDEDVDEPKKEMFKKGIIYEIWDKETKQAIWVSKRHKEGPLKVLDDPLGLEDFFPCPRPLLATTTSDSLVPTPDFSIYQNMAEQLETLTKRIEHLEDQVRIMGAYNPDCGELAKLFESGAENQLVPAKDWVSFAQSGGFKGAMDFVPIAESANALMQLYQARDRLKSDLYEITGMSDIIRGSSNPGDTATAQQIKGQFAQLRLTDRQQEVQRFARDIIRIMCEIVAEHFSHETVMKMSGAEFQVGDETIVLFNDAMILLEDDTLRGYHLDIETDSTLAIDEQLEQEGRVNFLNAVGQFMQQLAGVNQMGPEFMPVFNEVLMFGIKGFRAGRPLERTFEEALKQAADARKEAAKQPPPPDPKMMELQAKQQMEGQKMQFEQQKFGAEMQQKMQEMQGDFQLQREKIQGELAIGQQKVQGELQLGQQKMQIALQELQADLMKIRGELEIKEADVAGDFALEKLKIATQAQQDAKQQERDSQKESAAKEASETKEPSTIIVPSNGLKNSTNEKVVDVVRDASGKMLSAVITESEKVERKVDIVRDAKGLMQSAIVKESGSGAGR